MNKDLRNKIIIALFTALFTASGFLGKDYFERKNHQKEYVEKLYKQLFDEGAIALDEFNSAYSELYSVYTNGYALTTYELEPHYTKFQNAIESYQKYVKKLERYGNSEQVQVAKSLSEWIWDLYSEFYMQYQLAETVQRRVQELMLIEDPKSDMFKFVNDALDEEIERLVQTENRVFFETGGYKRPVVSSLEQYLNYQFRVSIGLEATTEMAKIVNGLPEQMTRKTEKEYKENKFPFMFAVRRVFLAPTLEFSGEEEHFKQRDNGFKAQAKMKFIALVIENDKKLQDILKERKSNAESKG